MLKKVEKFNSSLRGRKGREWKGSLFDHSTGLVRHRKSKTTPLFLSNICVGMTKQWRCFLVPIGKDLWAISVICDLHNGHSRLHL